MSSNDTALSQCVVEQLEVRLLEKALGGSNRVGRVSDDDVEAVLVLLKELEAVANVNGGLGVGKAD